jgi:hypothetical protein
MKKTYHLCLSGDNEIMFRTNEDYHRAFNCFALALHKTDSTGLAEAIMSTHCHLLVQTSEPKEFMHDFRLMYSHYFNRKYHRSGRLGERFCFTMEIFGYHHILAAISYILRNPPHHGVAPTPYAYPHCSANAIFMSEMGKFTSTELLHPRNYHRYIGKTATFPDNYKMSKSGVFLRESVLDIPQVENLFVTPRMFNFYMSRKSSEEWREEQNKDQNEQPAICIENIERGASSEDVKRMLIYENGRADYRKISDIELCHKVDNIIVPAYHKTSVYQLSIEEKQKIGEQLYREYHLSEERIRRCLIL